MARRGPRGGYTPREWVLIALLGLTGAMAWWWQQGQRPAPGSIPAAERRPDYVVDELAALTLDAAGQPLRRLWAERLRHYPDDGSSELDQPLLLALKRDQRGAPTPPWQVQGDTAWINAAGDEVLLQGNVLVRRDATAESPPLRLTSAELLLLPDFDYAETAQFARLTGGQDQVTAAGGLRVWFGEPLRAVLFGRVMARLGPAVDDQTPGSPAAAQPPPLASPDRAPEKAPETGSEPARRLPPRPDLPR